MSHIAEQTIYTCGQNHLGPALGWHVLDIILGHGCREAAMQEGKVPFGAGGVSATVPVVTKFPVGHFVAHSPRPLAFVLFSYL